MFGFLFKFIGSLNGSGSGNACWRIFIDEPKMPKHMIEK